MKEIGLAMGVVESRVSQIHSSAVVHLRGTLRNFERKQNGIAMSKGSTAAVPRAKLESIGRK